jgi:hypothetical protein
MITSTEYDRMKDPVLQDEARHDRECELDREIWQATIDEETDDILNRIAYGEYDADLASYFDGAVLMRVARIFATKDFELAYSLAGGDLIDIKNGLREYARDLAKMRIE